MRRIVIIGGGFGGVQCAKRLRKALSERQWEIVLFAQDNAMIFYPLLAEVAGAAIGADAVAVPLRQLLPDVRCRTEAVWHVQTDASCVEYQGEDGQLHQMPFDHCVIACGSVVDLDAVPGMADHAFPLKSVGDALALRHHVMQLLEKAEVCDDPVRRRRYLSIAVVGGGFSGVEIAGELNDLLSESARFYDNFTREDVSVTVLHAREQILPEVSPTLREVAHRAMEAAGLRILCNTRVVSATAEGVELQDGRTIEAATVVCTVGTTMPELIQRVDVPKDRGWLVADPDMRLSGQSRIWAVGDCARIRNAYDGQLSPTTGQFAERQGAQAAANIVRAINGRATQPFSYRPLGQLCGIGARKAVADIMGWRLSGLFAWWLWRTIYLLKMPSWSRRAKLALDWTWDLVFPRDLAYPRPETTDRIARAHYRAGDEIVRLGDAATHFYMVESGEVDILRPGEQGAERLVATVRCGDFFGELALLEGTRRTATARARTPVEVLVMGREMFSQLSRSLTPFRTVVAQALQWRRPRTNPGLSALWDRLAHQPVSTFQETVPPGRLTPGDGYEAAIRLFDEQAVEVAPVVDSDGRLVGIVSRVELFAAFARGTPATALVDTIMQGDPPTATPTQSSLDAADTMHRHDMDWLPVVDGPETRRLVGVLRSERMLRHMVSALPTAGSP